MLSKKLTPELCKRMRKEAGLSQEEFGELMGWSKRTVINREQKEFKLSFAEFDKFIMVTTTSTEVRKERKRVMKQIGVLMDAMLSTDNGKEQTS